MSPRTRRIAAMLLGASAASCSLLLRLETEQCTGDADCVGRGPAFAARVCVSGQCAAPAVADGGVDADAHECDSTSDCVAARGDESVCRLESHRCVRLTSEECPILLGGWRDPNAMFMGGYTWTPSDRPTDSVVTQIYTLAVDELNTAGHGLPPGSGSARRPVAMVLCTSDTPEKVVAGGLHLANIVHVSGLISLLQGQDLVAVLDAAANPNHLFVLNAGPLEDGMLGAGADSRLWHLLGGARQLAPAFASATRRAERFLGLPGAGAGSGTKLAIVSSSETPSAEMLDELRKTLRFNDKDVSANGALYTPVSVVGKFDIHFDEAQRSASYAAAATTLLRERPNIIVANTTDEMIEEVIPRVETGWPASGQARPFYILGHRLVDLTKVLDFIDDSAPGARAAKRKRMVGINYASAPDPAVKNTFLDAMVARFGRDDALLARNFENVYDAVYYLAYATAAIGATPLSGDALSSGMSKLLRNGSERQEIPVGPAFISKAFVALAGGDPIALLGTLGPSDFDVTLRARRSEGSLFCFGSAALRGAGTSDVPEYFYDELRLGEGGELGGTLRCFPGF